MQLKSYMVDVNTRPTNAYLKRVSEVLKYALDKHENVDTFWDDDVADYTAPKFHPLDADTLLKSTYELANGLKDLYLLRQALGWVMVNPDINLWSKKYVETNSTKKVEQGGYCYYSEGAGYFVGTVGHENFTPKVIDKINQEIDDVINQSVVTK